MIGPITGKGRLTFCGDPVPYPGFQIIFHFLHHSTIEHEF